jgi:integrase
MPYPATHIPKLQRHVSTGRAFARFAGREVYFGTWGTPEAKARYDDAVRRWLDNGRRLPGADERTTVTELLAAFWEHAERHYVKAGRPTSEQHTFRSLLRLVRRLYGGTAADDFGPVALETCRRELVAGGYARRSVNQHVGRIRSVWRWGVSRQLVAPETVVALGSLPPLLRGRTEAPETEPVTPVPEADLAATLPLLPPVLRTVAEFQLLTGARPAEALSLRWADVDADGAKVGHPGVWLYRVRDGVNKTEHHGRSRTVLIGPRAQELIRPLLTADPAAPVFRKPRRPGGPYTVGGYRQAVESACEAAALAFIRESRPDVWLRLALMDRVWRDAESAYGSSAFKVAKPTKAERKRLRGEATEAGRRLRSALAEVVEVLNAPRPWHPHRLRHNAASRLEAEFGIEVAQYALGHSTPAMTRVYSDAHLRRAAAAVGKSG